MTIWSSYRASIGVLYAMLAICQLPDSFADEKPTTDDAAKVEAKEAAELASEEMTQWSFRLPKEPSRELALNKTPILRWTNPAVGRVYGNVYVVVSDNCPQAIVCPYKWFVPWTSLDMECVSLTSAAIEGTREGKMVWSTEKPGVEWKPVPGHPAAGKSSLERQRQMKKLAEEFTAELLDMRINQKGEDQQLRQMTQPVYRYESIKHHVIEGGVFAYVMGTDPELFLLLEVIDEEKSSSWRYGLARMNTDRLAVKFQGNEIWQVGKVSHEIAKTGKQPYLSFNVRSK